MIYSKNPQSVLTVALLSAGIAGLTYSVPAAGVGLSFNPAVDFADQQQVGSSTLARNPAGLTMTLETSGVASGHALTVWWVVFNNPQECATAPCSAEDLTNPAVQADVLGAADGAVVGEKRAEGARDENHDNGEYDTTYFASHLNVGDTAPSINTELLGLEPVGLLDPKKAEVHLVVRSHGPAIPGQIEAQTTTYAGGCAVFQTPPEVPEQQGECADIQFSIHQPQRY